MPAGLGFIGCAAISACIFGLLRNPSMLRLTSMAISWTARKGRSGPHNFRGERRRPGAQVEIPTTPGMPSVRERPVGQSAHLATLGRVEQEEITSATMMLRTWPPTQRYLNPHTPFSRGWCHRNTANDGRILRDSGAILKACAVSH